MKKEASVAKTQKAKDINVEETIEQDISEETCRCNSQCDCGDP